MEQKIYIDTLEFGLQTYNC